VQQDKTNGVKHQGGGAITEFCNIGRKEVEGTVEENKTGLHDLQNLKIVSRRRKDCPL